MKKPAALAALALLALSAAATATAGASTQDPDEFTPVGYEFCGWQDFANGGWTLEQPDPGAYLRLFARDMTCRAARRNLARTRYTQLPPHRPVRAGYRCLTLEDDYEYGDVRCSKIGRPRTAFRWQSGA